jgi:hypothetical protein
MRSEQFLHLRSLEGNRVSVALSDGSRLDDCHLVSAGRPNMRTVWLYSDGIDLFMQWADILDVWESGCFGPVHVA